MVAATGLEVVAVFGPTASGKSAVAAVLADRLGTDIVSADALQVYRELPVLTNQAATPPRLSAIRSVRDTMSVGEYTRLAHAEIDLLVARSGTAVVAGGTGLYLRAALTELRLPPAVSADVRARWEAEYDADPAQAFAELARRDSAAARGLHVNDRRRVVRALELTDAGASLAPSEDRLWSGPARRPTLVAGLVVPPPELERRIRARAEDMFERDVVGEVGRALAIGVSATAEKALGLREIAALPRAEALERIVTRTRQYAAYQRKWMRRIPELVAVDGCRAPHEVADAILEVAHSRCR